MSETAQAPQCKSEGCLCLSTVDSGLCANCLQAENERLREALTSCQLAVENTNWGWDGDCGLGNHIGYIVETALEGGDDN